MAYIPTFVGLNITNMNPFIILIGAFVVIAAIRSFVVISTNQRGMIIRLGRNLRYLEPGYHIRIPAIDLVEKVDLKASIPGWQGLSRKDLEKAVRSFIDLGTSGISQKSGLVQQSTTRPVERTPELNCFSDWLVQAASKKVGADLNKDELAKTRIKEAAQAALAEIQNTESALINLPFLTADASGPKHFELSIDKALLQQILRA